MNGNDILYIAGPITAPTPEERLSFIETAEEIALEIELLGIPTICVHSKARVWWGRIPEGVIIQNDLVLLESCQGLVLCPGWERSRGTIGEIMHAGWHGIPCWEPGMFLAGPLENARDRSTPHNDLIARAQVQPHPGSELRLQTLARKPIGA